MKFIVYRTSSNFNMEDLTELNINITKYNVSIETIIDRFGNKCKNAIIEINTLEDLIELNNDYGAIIIHMPYFNKEFKEIEIYDDWRE